MNLILRHFVKLSAGLIIAVSAQAAPVVEMLTSRGTIIIDLNQEKAPKSVENFLKYAKDGFYNGTIFHRVIDGFMIQGGGFTQELAQKPTGRPVPNEGKNGLKNLRGTLSMARLSDPDSATAQFFINHKDNPGLDYPSPDGAGYAVFGKVIKGIEIIDIIAKAPTVSLGMHQNVPLEPVVIQSVKIISDKK